MQDTRTGASRVQVPVPVPVPVPQLKQQSHCIMPHAHHFSFNDSSVSPAPVSCLAAHPAVTHCKAGVFPNFHFLACPSGKLLGGMLLPKEPLASTKKQEPAWGAWYVAACVYGEFSQAPLHISLPLPALALGEWVEDRQGLESRPV